MAVDSSSQKSGASDYACITARQPRRETEGAYSAFDVSNLGNFAHQGRSIRKTAKPSRDHNLNLNHPLHLYLTLAFTIIMPLLRERLA